MLQSGKLDDAAFVAAVEGVRAARALDAASRRRLRELVIVFLAEKEITGMGGFSVDDRVCYLIAVQACLLVLELGIECYDGWTSVYVYPGSFREADGEAEGGVFAGVAMQGGAVALSWTDAVYGAADGRDGFNPVLHEFAHKLDMADGAANGVPPLPDDMDPAEWGREFADAFAELGKDVDDGRRTRIDPYGATNPAEFFAVLSETFFEKPQAVRKEMPAVHELLVRYYRQDPMA